MVSAMVGLTEEAYTAAFHKHFKRTVSFLHIKYRVQTREAATEYALEGWSRVWQYRETFDPAKSSIETFANMCCFQAMVKCRTTLWAKAIEKCKTVPVHRFSGQRNDDDTINLVPEELQTAPDVEENINRLDAELVLSLCRPKVSAVLRRYYLEEQRVPLTTLKRARDEAREIVRRSQHV